MAQQLRTLITLAEDPGPIHPRDNSQPSIIAVPGISHPLLASVGTAHTHTHTVHRLKCR